MKEQTRNTEVQINEEEIGKLPEKEFRKMIVNMIKNLESKMEKMQESINKDPMNRSTPGFPVYHQLPEFTQTHVHRVSDAMQPSHPLSSPSPPALNPSQHQVFSNESALHIRWPKYWSFSFNISPCNK